MHKIFSLISVALLLIVASCDNQKPSPRIRAGQADAIRSAGGRKVMFTRTSETSTPEINVEMNGVPFKMLWDTGATGTSISMQECMSLYKAGELSDNDIIGEVLCTVADGSTVKVPVYAIREVVIRTDGEPFIVNNVEVSVMPSLSASMLLGQNVMKELPEHVFNESSCQIEFKDR
ncbi:MAG: retropepsin-like aspartic protease [Muribaculaceae bacterium]|nr:retropepsin-like aspartic protease [Muribaculaceae bacterium]MDE6367203.1 retroviral-like aspartic protease family protein [Muribaculaceae bacterium]